MTAPASPEPAAGAQFRFGAEPLSIAFLAPPNSIHTRRWTGYLAGRGHKVTLIVGEDQAIEPGLAEGIEIERYAGYARGPARVIRALKAARSLRQVLGRVKPDVLHSHYLVGNGWLGWLSRFHPYVITVWGSDVLVVARSTRRARLSSRIALQGADLVTGTSRHLLDVAVEVGARRDRTRLIHNGVDLERFRPGPDPAGLRARLGLKGRRVIFSPRTIAAIYHHETVVGALPGLPGDVVVLMTRHLADAAELARLERQAAELGVADRVAFVDAVPYGEMPDFYRLADVVVSVAEHDGGPMCVVEALAAERPMVATDLPAVREWQAVLDPAALVPVADTAATARAIAHLLGRKPADRAGLAQRGRAEVVARADERENMARMETLYGELVARRKGRA